jgi:hypothetical protein
MLIKWKRVLSLTIFFILNTSADAAEILKSHVVDIIDPTHRNEAALILLATDGRVIRLAADETHILERFREAVETNTPLSIEFIELGNVHAINSVRAISEEELYSDTWTYESEDRNFLSPHHSHLLRDPEREEMEEYSSTTSSYTPNQLWSFLHRKNLRRGAQCFHRAYVWAYDMQRELGRSSEKVFLFFTSRYVRQYGYNWWFHVAPYVNYGGHEYVLDPTFTRGPLQMRAWTNQFLASNAHCPTVHRYYGYNQHYQDQHCYIRKTHMYYYHPTDVQKHDRSNTRPQGWNQAALRSASQSRP